MPPKNRAKRARVVEPTFLGCNFTKTQQAYWKNLYDTGRKIKVTKFFDIPTLDKLQLTDVVRTFLEKGGMGGFISLCAPTYERFTLEFLCTLEVDSKGQQFKFQLGNTPRQMDFATLRRVFGLSARGSEKYIALTDTQVSDFWFQITKEPFPKDGAKASSIPHPGLRVIYRIISMGFFCQGEPANAVSWELGRFWSLTPDGIGTPDWAAYFLAGCLDCRKVEKGNISMGGMITLIAKDLKVDLSGEVPLSADPELNFLSLTRMKMLTKDKRTRSLIWLFGQANIPYMWMPRARGFPTGPHNSDLFVGPDPDIGGALASVQAVSHRGEGDEDERADLRTTAPAAVRVKSAPSHGTPVREDNEEWLTWRKGVEATMQSIRDDVLCIRDAQEDLRYETEVVRSRQDEILDYVKSFSVLSAASFPSSYVAPDVQRFRDDDRRRERERRLVYDLRSARARGGSEPSGSH